MFFYIYFLSLFLLFFCTVGILFISIDQTHQLTSNINKNRPRLPAYSLQNMPKTDFSCRGKILGGYYADADTQCQMFHICVKIAGVGVGCEFFFFWLLSKLWCKSINKNHHWNVFDEPSSRLTIHSFCLVALFLLTQWVIA